MIEVETGPGPFKGTNKPSIYDTRLANTGGWGFKYSTLD